MMKLESRSALIRRCLFLVFMSLISAGLWAEGKTPMAFDVAAPTLIHEEMEKVTNIKAELLIKAHVSDDVGVQSVIVNYRRPEAQDYKQVSMSRVGTTDEFQAAIPTDFVQEPGLEYYIQATDLAGNAVLRGYAFAPLTLAIEDLPLLGSDNTEQEKKASKRKWLWIGLGILATAAIASSGGGGGDDTNNNITAGVNSGDDEDDSFVITAPIPTN